MSDTELLSEVYALTIQGWMSVSINALAIFEYLITLDQEVSSVWKAKRSGASMLLFAIRFTMLVSAIMDPIASTKLSAKECMGGFIVGTIFSLFGTTLIAVFSALRVYALCGGSIASFVVVFLLQLCPVVVNVYGNIESTYGFDPMFGCMRSPKFGLRTNEVLILTSRIPLIVGDALVILITWKKSFKQVRMQRSLGVHLPLSTLLFRDGTVYFLILLAINALEVSPLTASEGGFVIGVLSANLPLILVNRFMLNLRQLSDSDVRSTSRVLTPMFGNNVDVAGNMGESLEFARQASDADEDDIEAESFRYDAHEEAGSSGSSHGLE